MRIVDALSLGMVAILCAAALGRSAVIPSGRAILPSGRSISVVVSSDSLDSAEAHVLERNVFGAPQLMSGTAAAQNFSPRAPILIPPGVFRASLMIQAIAGPPWVAVLSGIPGHNAQIVVTAGDTVGTYRIRSISTDSVIIQAPDSVIHLTFTKAGS